MTHSHRIVRSSRMKYSRRVAAFIIFANALLLLLLLVALVVVGTGSEGGGDSVSSSSTTLDRFVGGESPSSSVVLGLLFAVVASPLTLGGEPWQLAACAVASARWRGLEQTGHCRRPVSSLFAVVDGDEEDLSPTGDVLLAFLGVKNLVIMVVRLTRRR